MEIRKTDKSADELIDGGQIEKSELARKIQQLHIFFSLLKDAKRNSKKNPSKTAYILKKYLYLQTIISSL